MTEYLNYLILGLGAGALFGALAMALVVTGRGSGMLNLAVGTQAFYGATTYALLRQGRLLQPIPWLPGRIAIGGRVPFVPAVVMALAIQAGVALVLYAAVFRPLQGRGPTVQTIASLGVAAALDALVDLQIGGQPVAVHRIFSASSLHIGGVRIPADRVAPALVTVGIGLLVAARYRLRRGAGVASLLARRPGIGSPLGNWLAGAVLAGLVGILVAPFLPLLSGQYALLVVPALAAAAVGRVANVGVAVGGGLAIGALESVTVDIAVRHPGFPSRAGDAVPLLVVILAVIVRGSWLPSPLRTLSPARLAHSRLEPRARSVLPVVVVGAAALFLLPGAYRLALTNAFIFSVIALSLVVITGLLGQISFAQLALAGVAGFSLSTVAHSWGVPFPIAPVVAAGASAVVAAAIGLLSLRGRGLAGAAISLAVATGAEGLWFVNVHLDGGVGGAPVPVPRLFGIDLGIGAPGTSVRTAFGLLCLVVLAWVFLAVRRLDRSRLGASLRAVGADPDAAAAAGFPVARIQLAGFALAGFVAGIGGCLIAYEQSHLTFSGFDALLGLIFLATVYLAGVTSVRGGVLAGLISAGGPLFVWLNHYFPVGTWYGVIVGVGVVLVGRYDPDGMVGLAASMRRRARRFFDV